MAVRSTKSPTRIIRSRSPNTEPSWIGPGTPNRCAPYRPKLPGDSHHRINRSRPGSRSTFKGWPRGCMHAFARARKTARGWNGSACASRPLPVSTARISTRRAIYTDWRLWLFWKVSWTRAPRRDSSWGSATFSAILSSLDALAKSGSTLGDVEHDVFVGINRLRADVSRGFPSPKVRRNGLQFKPTPVAL